MKKLVVLSTAILLALGQYASAQPKIQEILQRLPDKVIPYVGLCIVYSEQSRQDI